MGTEALFGSGLKSKKPENGYTKSNGATEYEGRLKKGFGILVVAILSIVGLRLIAASQPYDRYFSSSIVDTTADMSGDPMNDENIFDVNPPEHLFGDRIVFTSVICDHSGSCNTTGLVKNNVDFKFRIASSCFVKNGEEIPSTMKAVKYVKHKKKQVKVYAANTFFQLESRNETTGEIEYPDTFQAICGNKETDVPVLLRAVRTFNDKVVLLVTQYYTEVSLAWLKIWLTHYFDIGVDYVALYAGFHTEKDERKSNYTMKLDALIDTPPFKDRILFFKWDSIAALQTWAHSQASMINHGASYFKGSTILCADLDELVVPRIKPNLKDLVKYYDNRYGTWALQFHSYIKGGSYDVRRDVQAHVDSGDLDWSSYIPDMHPCGGSPRFPWQCRAKYMFHSLDITHLGIHTLHFEMVNYTEAWLDDNVAVMLHFRGIQHGKWPKSQNMYL
mmetsp:Transcript_11390/g.13051  ORF Transcript_11390/g.13051 Transcript_11390/m.13051 type:complete len:446 (-) Transcript_11390:41-1378(-)